VLHYLTPFTPGWKPRALACSALEEEGLDAIWNLIREFERLLRAEGTFERRRREQNRQWFQTLLREAVLTRFFERPAVRDILGGVEEDVSAGALPVAEAIEKLLAA